MTLLHEIEWEAPLIGLGRLYSGSPWIVRSLVRFDAQRDVLVHIESPTNPTLCVVDAQRDVLVHVDVDLAYRLLVETADKWMAGTDANITFTLTGSLGTASKTVDAKLIKRMEQEESNWSLSRATISACCNRSPSVGIIRAMHPIGTSTA